MGRGPGVAPVIFGKGREEAALLAIASGVAETGGSESGVQPALRNVVMTSGCSFDTALTPEVCSWYSF